MGSDKLNGAEDQADDGDRRTNPQGRYSAAAEAARRARATAAAQAAARRRGTDTMDPRQPPPGATIVRPARRHGMQFDDEAETAERTRVWQRLLAVVAMVAVVAVGVVLIVAGGHAQHHAKRVVATVKPTTTPTASAKPAATPKPAAAAWGQYVTGAYTASYPPGWSVAEDNVPIGDGAYLETRFVKPGGSTEIDIDRTPHDPDTPAQAAATVEATARGESGYESLAFAAVTLAGTPAWKWAFLAPASGRIAISGYHVDFFRQISGGRYATLGVGGRRGSTARLTERVAASITPH